MSRRLECEKVRTASHMDRCDRRFIGDDDHAFTLHARTRIASDSGAHNLASRRKNMLVDNASRVTRRIRAMNATEMRLHDPHLCMRRSLRMSGSACGNAQCIALRGNSYPCGAWCASVASGGAVFSSQERACQSVRVSRMRCMTWLSISKRSTSSGQRQRP